MTKYILGFLFLGILFASCSKDEDQAIVDQRIIEQYLQDNNINAQEHPSGLYYLIDTPGTGGHPDIMDSVEVRYKGYLTNGFIFDQTPSGQTSKFPLMNLIEGWQVGIPLLQKDGKGTLYLPSGLGYGSNSNAVIPANSVLIFDIELIDFWR